MLKALLEVGKAHPIEQENPAWKTGRLEYPYFQYPQAGRERTRTPAAPSEESLWRGINLTMLVDTLDVLLQSLQEHRYHLFVEPAEHWYRQGQILLGRREFLVMDPDGYLLRFAQSLGERTL